MLFFRQKLEHLYLILSTFGKHNLTTVYLFYSNSDGSFRDDSLSSMQYKCNELEEQNCQLILEVTNLPAPFLVLIDLYKHELVLLFMVL